MVLNVQCWMSYSGRAQVQEMYNNIHKWGRIGKTRETTLTTIENILEVSRYNRKKMTFCNGHNAHTLSRYLNRVFNMQVSMRVTLCKHENRYFQWYFRIITLHPLNLREVQISANWGYAGQLPRFVTITQCVLSRT